MAAPPFRRTDSLRAATAGLQYLLVPGGRLLPLGRPAVAHRIRMGNRCAPRRLQSDVWQRVAVDVERLPSISGFSEDPYKEYSSPWFRTHKSLRGGAFTTRSRMMRPAYRNFYTPERSDIWAGFRTCALES